jgi:phage shock protein A
MFEVIPHERNVIGIVLVETGIPELRKRQHELCEQARKAEEDGNDEFARQLGEEIYQISLEINKKQKELHIGLA